MAGEDDHEHDDFTSFVVSTAAYSNAETAAEHVASAMQAAGVLRIKGTVMVEDKAARLAVQAVGPRVETWFAPTRAGARAPGLVVIGLADMDRTAVERALGG